MLSIVATPKVVSGAAISLVLAAASAELPWAGKPAPGEIPGAVGSVAPLTTGTTGEVASPPKRAGVSRDVARPESQEIRLLRRRLQRAPFSDVLTVSLPNGVPLELVLIAGGGSFMMGAPIGEPGSLSWEMPWHMVSVRRDFYLGRCEVTQGQWQAVMGSNPAHGYGVGATFPVYYVSWDDVAGPGGFIDKLNGALGTTGFRLPSEAEWEYAARGGTITPFSFPSPARWDTQCGSFPAAEPFMLWCGVEWLGGTSEVGQMLPNPWGLFDMHGNVWEWVQDWFHPTFVGAPTDGSAWLDPPGSLRIIRGGAWNAPASYCRSAQRGPLTSDHKCFNTGFRLAFSP